MNFFEMMNLYTDALDKIYIGHILAMEKEGKAVTLSQAVDSLGLLEFPLSNGYIAKQYINSSGGRGVRFEKMN